MTDTRQHPAVLFRYSGGFLFALLAPLVPVVLSGAPVGYWLFVQLPLAAVVILWGILRWKKCLWRNGGSVSLSSGVLLKHSRIIPQSSIACIELCRSPFLSLIGASRVTFRTPSQPNDRKLSLTLGRKNAADLILSTLPLGLSKDGVSDRSSARETAILAASGSNMASGLLILIPVISKLSKLGIAAAERLEEGAYTLLPRLPKAAAIATFIPAVGWLLHFFYNCIHNARFESIRSGNCIIIRRGAISRRTSYLPTEHISAVDTRRTLLLLFFKRASAAVLSNGCAPFHIIPAARESELKNRLSFIIPRPHGMPVELEPDRGCRPKYYLIRLVFTLVSACLLIRLSYGSSTERLFAPAFIPVTVLLVWYTLIGAAASMRAKVVLSGDSVEITGSRFFTVHTVRIYRSQIAEIKIKQSPLQIQRGLCDLYIRPCGQKHGIACRFLSIERAEKFSLMLR
ncbi:MAG: hypothetical protein E7546_00125 [Ruminococcaceae bacterium]|nr:hypothetical protein [Oscillospiraceae bacterium]